MAKIANASEAGHDPYHLRISRLTIDKLGVKLYDKASAVVAELVANGYDADAENVTVRVPLGTLLATKQDEGKKQVIEVIDNGHGMTPKEAIEFYLEVGSDRRTRPGGEKSRSKKRPVMGRKGIGKLAPFGICQRIEIISAGGPKTSKGYRIAHFFLDYKDIVKDEDTDVPIMAGSLDGKYAKATGTTVRLTQFLARRVPDLETFSRQLASRFVFARSDFAIAVEDTRHPKAAPHKIKPVDVPIVENTKIDLSKRPVETESGKKLKVSGWLAMAKNPYKTEELAGVRIYARNKIVAMTRDFEQPAGFTGEFSIRSYLVGEVHAEWLDLDRGEDLIRSDRQGILWDSDYGRALREWGAKLIKEIGKSTMKPRRERVKQQFMERSKFEERANNAFADKEIADVAIDIAKQIGSFAAEDELSDEEYLDGMSDFIISIAPHRALIEAFQKFSQEVDGGEKPSLHSLLSLFGKTRVAEMASYSQIAAERVRAIRQLQKLVVSNDVEDELQQLIADAPWLVEATWTVLTKNQTLKTLKTSLESYYKNQAGKTVVLAIDKTSKRPDFTLISMGHKLHIVEIKRTKKAFDDKDAERLLNYIDIFDRFFEDNPDFKKEFPDGYEITLITDSLSGMKKAPNKLAIAAIRKDKKLVHWTWREFLNRAVNAHKQFLEINDKMNGPSK